jgi:hypothetical protein
VYVENGLTTNVSAVNPENISVTTAWRVFSFRLEELPSDMEGSCEYI